MLTCFLDWMRRNRRKEEKDIPIGYAYYAKGSGELILVKNPKQFNLPHVFPIYGRKD